MDALLRGLNDYVGAFAAGCLIALVFCCYALGLAGNAIYRFHMDYRKVNRLDEREEHENAL
jgi:hypothetical protein